MARSTITGLILVTGILSLSTCKMLGTSYLKEGVRGGNGKPGLAGNVVVCPTERAEFNGKRAMLLDLWEARDKLKFAFKPLPGDTPVMKLRLLLSGQGALHRIDPARADRILYVGKNLLDNVDGFLRYNMNLPRLADEGVAVHLPDAACKLEMAAFQPEEEAVTPVGGDHGVFPTQSEPGYTIRKELWDLLDDDNRAGLLLHEIVYHDLTSNPPDEVFVRAWPGFSFDPSFSMGSREVRRFVSLVMSSIMETISVKDYAASVESIGFDAVTIRAGIRTKLYQQPGLDGIDLHSRGSFHVKLCGDVPLPGCSENRNWWIRIGSMDRNSPPGTATVLFAPDGTVSRIKTDGALYFQFRNDASLGGQLQLGPTCWLKIANERSLSENEMELVQPATTITFDHGAITAIHAQWPSFAEDSKTGEQHGPQRCDLFHYQ